MELQGTMVEIEFYLSDRGKYIGLRSSVSIKGKEVESAEFEEEYVPELLNRMASLEGIYSGKYAETVGEQIKKYGGPRMAMKSRLINDEQNPLEGNRFEDIKRTRFMNKMRLSRQIAEEGRRQAREK